ncbi:MAG: helix-hairpin-helix domain-containing protein [Bacteroidetes bacterium]|nr:helix-hairpin-helix domain-containing protein [Bacteroidota bacterium]
MKSSYRDYFLFSRAQQKAILFLLTLIALLTTTYYFLPIFYKPHIQLPDKELQVWMANIEQDSNQRLQANHNLKPAKLTPFVFNPNTLSEDGFRKIGLRDKLISTLINYRNKGGKFYNAESLRRIYGLHAEEFAQLEPFIDIPAIEKKQDVLHIELNSADTTELIKLKGIGSKLSQNIVTYRKLLGGFVHLKQLTEVYGISDETLTRITPSLHINKSKIKQINLNEATLYELNAHPYLKGEIARALVDFRKAHNYQIVDLTQIKEIALINEEKYRKIVPYLRIQ